MKKDDKRRMLADRVIARHTTT